MILGAVLDLPANQHSQSGPIPLKKGWIGCAYYGPHYRNGSSTYHGSSSNTPRLLTCHHLVTCLV